jgi:hypothetical protein
MSCPWPLQKYKGLRGLEELDLDYEGSMPPAPLGLCALTQLKQLAVSVGTLDASNTAAVVSWVHALAGLVHLELLSLPGVMVDCWHPWLTGLTRLVVLDVHGIDHISDKPAAAAHLSQLLAPSPDGGCSTAAPMQQAVGRVRMVCLQQCRGQDLVLSGGPAQLYAALVAAVPVLPHNRHLFRGSWLQLQQCGVELWPSPVCARLQQLVV